MDHQVEPTVYRYPDQPPGDGELLAALGLQNRDYFFVTATLAQEQARRKLTPAAQRVPPSPWRVRQGGGAGSPDAWEPALVFHKFLRLLLGVPLATRAEERVLLQRAVRKVSPVLGPDLTRTVTGDLLTWRSALAEATARGVDAARPRPEDGPVLAAAMPEVVRVLQVLQPALYLEEADNGRLTLEEAAITFLEDRLAGLAPRPVVFYGFTFLTPLQQRFVAACSRYGFPVYFVHPYRDGQGRGFQILDRTYAGFSVAAPALPSPPLAGAGRLGFLQRALFADAPGDPAPEDGTVLLEEYRHRHHEVAACVRRIAGYLAEGVPARQIAVVTRNARELDPLLQEEAARQGLQGRFSVPPRLLLLTPLGRFALTLYAVWVDGELRLPADAFETILASGWLGAALQETADRFSGLRGQWFERCERRDDWEARLLRIRQAADELPRDSRAPAAMVDEETVQLWQEALRQVERLCRRLFTAEEQSIGAHIQRLLETLHSVVREEELLQAEREVLERIRVALTEVADSTSLPISSAEFGDVLVSLAQEYRQSGEGEDGVSEDPERIWVTTPEGIDGCTRDVVFYLGVDSQRVARAYSQPWPFLDGSVSEHQERERYMFLAVVRAARTYLHLSFARVDEGGTYGASPYLRWASELLAQPVRAPEPDLRDAEPVSEPEGPALRRARRREYSLAEIAHYALCPFRYKLERLDAAARCYRSPFQLSFLAQSVWLDLTLRRLHGDPPTRYGQAGTVLLASMAAARTDVEAEFPGLRRHQWLTVEKYVARDLQHLAGFVDTFPMQLLPGEPAEVMVPDGDRHTRVLAPVHHTLVKGRYGYPVTQDLLRREWLLPSLAGQSKDDSRLTRVDGIPLFATLLHAVQWWEKGTRTAVSYRGLNGQAGERAEAIRVAYTQLQRECTDWLAHLEVGGFPKNPGPHCRLCPVQGDCLGIRE